MIRGFGKDLLSSKTFWGAMLVVAGIACSFFGVEPSSIVSLAGRLIEVIGVMTAIWGRVTATDTIEYIAGVRVK